MEIDELYEPTLIIDERNNYYFASQIDKQKKNVYLVDAIVKIFKDNTSNFITQENVKSIMGEKYDGDNIYSYKYPEELIKELVDKIETGKISSRIKHLDEIKKCFNVIFLNPWEKGFK